MRSSFTEENFETYLRESIGRRGGGRGKFGSYSKDPTWNTVDVSKDEAAAEEE